MTTLKRQQGLSLIEIMISLALGLVVLAGVAQVFVSTSSASRTQAAIVTLQESGRFAIERLKPIGRLAGRITACVADLEVQNHLDVAQGSVVDKLFSPDVPVLAWNFQNTGVGDSLTLGTLSAGAASAGAWDDYDNANLFTEVSSRSVAGSDVIVFKSARQFPNLTGCSGNVRAQEEIAVCDEDGVPRKSKIERRNMVLVTDCTSGADLFQNSAGDDGDADGALIIERDAGASDLAPGNRAGSWVTAYGDTMQVYAFDNYAYYVGVNADGTPALYELDLSQGIDVEPRELIEGVENMQVLIGEYIVANRQVVYREPQDVSDPRFIMSARLSLLIRAEGPDQLQDTNTYDVAGTTVDPTDDERVRQVFEVTINMRNNGEVL